MHALKKMTTDEAKDAAHRKVVAERASAVKVDRAELSKAFDSIVKGKVNESCTKHHLS